MITNVNIKIFDDTPFEEYEEMGITTKLIETIFKSTFEKLLDKACAGECGYSIDVKVEE